MRRFWVHALLALSCFYLNGCGGSNETQTAESSSSGSSSSSSSRPTRGGGNSSGSNSESGGASESGGRQSSKRSPSMSGGDGSGGGDMSGDPRMNQNKKKELVKPDSIPQKRWDGMSDRAKKTAMTMGAGGGSSSSSSGSASGGGQMTGDPRMNGGGSGEDNAAGGQMTGDPRMNGGGGGSASMAPGGEMSGDPRMNGGGGGGSGSSMAPGGQMSGDPRMNGGGNSSGQAAPKKPVTLEDKGIASFQDGDDDGGFQYLYGHFIAEDQGRQNIPLQFLSTIKRPRTEIRWGVGVVYTKGKGFEGDPPKIGEKPNVTASASGSGRGRSGRSPGGAGGGRSPSSGGSGSGSPGGGAGAGAGGAGTPDSGGGSPGAGAGAGSPDGGAGFGAGASGGSSGGNRNRRRDTGNPEDGGISELRYYAGDVGDEIVTWIEKIRKNGNNGSLLASVDANGPGSSAGNASSSGSSSSGMMLTRNSSKKKKADPVDESATSKLKNLAPGLIMLGKASKRDGLLGRAKAHAVDILVVVEVRTKFVPNTGLKLNDTKFSLYDVTTGKMERLGAASSPLNNNKVWLLKEKSEDKDPISAAVGRVFKTATIKVGDSSEKLTIGQYSKLASLPNLDQGKVMNRLSSLVSESLASGNPLRGLVELTYYRQKGWLPEKAYTDSVNKITESDIGKTLLNGSEKERVEALAPFLPPQWKVPEPANSDEDDDSL